MNCHKHWHIVGSVQATIGICNQEQLHREQWRHALPASEWQAAIAATGSPLRELNGRTKAKANVGGRLLAESGMWQTGGDIH